MIVHLAGEAHHPFSGKVAQGLRIDQRKLYIYDR
jgi:hypothetical protein